MSTNNGVSWSVYKTFSIHDAYDGSTLASNFVQGILYYSVELDNDWLNCTKIYPDYSVSSPSFNSIELNSSEAILLSLGSLMVLMALARKVLPVPKSLKNSHQRKSSAA